MRPASGANHFLTAAIGMACLCAVSPARADDGPVSALGNMMKASPTLTVVSTGVVLTANVSFTALALTSGFGGQEYPSGVYVAQLAVAAPQAVGYLAVPFFFDISRWNPLETGLLLIPGQAWATGLAIHAGWALDPNVTLSATTRLSLSALIGTNYAFSATALAGLFHEKWLPFEIGALEVASAVAGGAFSVTRAAVGDDDGTAWIAMSAWSGLLLAHGVGSMLVEAPGSRVSATTPDQPGPGLALTPWVIPIEGGVLVGIGSTN